MKKMLEFIKRKYAWTIIMAIILSISTAFTLLDAFVIPKTYRSDTQLKNENTDTEAQTNNSTKNNGNIVLNGQHSSGQKTSVTTDYSYNDENINISIEKLSKNNVIFYVADIQVSDVNYLKSAFANNTFGKNITQTTSDMAQKNNAIFAVNGDYYGFRDTGLIIRNGVLYRDTARSSPDNQALTINREGELGIVTEGKVSGAALIGNGIIQSYSFGPVLVYESKLNTGYSTKVSKSANPRTAIGQISPLHYIFIVADGRSNESNGMTLTNLAQEFVDRGATIAYNLDGGGSSTMWLNGRIINSPTDGRSDGERSISDIIYIGK